MGCPSFQEWPIKKVTIVSHVDTRFHLLHMRKPQSKKLNLKKKNNKSQQIRLIITTNKENHTVDRQILNLLLVDSQVPLPHFEHLSP